jgi:hypothetical protein
MMSAGAEKKTSETLLQKAQKIFRKKPEKYSL